jgi:hypothetical protein
MPIACWREDDSVVLSLTRDAVNFHPMRNRSADLHRSLAIRTTVSATGITDT